VGDCVCGRVWEFKSDSWGIADDRGSDGICRCRLLAGGTEDPMRIIDNIRMRIDNIRSWWIERRLMKGLRNNWRLALKRHVKVTKLLNQHDKLDPGNGPIKVVLAWCDRRRKLYAMKEESNEKFNRCNNAIAELEMAIAARKIGQSIQDLTKENPSGTIPT